MVCELLPFSTELPFIKPVEVLQVSSKGGQYCDNSLELYINIPNGAVPEGNLLELEIGMCLYGPFRFFNKVFPIAPILMLYPLKNIQLNKSLTVTIPHIINNATDSDVENLGIQVIKADHSSLLVNEECIFDAVVESDLCFHTGENGNGLLSFSLPHFCFIMVRATSTSEAAERTGYCVCPLFPLPKAMSSGNFTYHLCVTYYMAPCLKVSPMQAVKAVLETQL